MIFESHFYAMMVYALIVSVILAFVRFDDKKEIYHYALKLFIFMTGGVIIASWIMYFL